MDMRSRVLELSLEKYCCAQIIMKIGLEFLDRENPDLIKAMKGLCLGTHIQEQCGTFSAAACLLSLFAEERAPDLIMKLAAWFEERFKTTCCYDILSANNDDLSKCGDLTAETCQHCFELLEKHGLIPEPD
jgi:hypothetical protein